MFCNNTLSHVDKFKLECWMGHSHSSRDNAYYLQNENDKKSIYGCDEILDNMKIEIEGKEHAIKTTRPFGNACHITLSK
jgi:hypothetical protein